MPYYVTKLVNPHAIEIGHTYPRDVAKQKERLLSEGQIEPISVRHASKDSDALYVLDVNNPDYFHYSDAQIKAAIELEWPTLMISVKELN